MVYRISTQEEYGTIFTHELLHPSEKNWAKIKKRLPKQYLPREDIAALYNAAIKGRQYDIIYALHAKHSLFRGELQKLFTFALKQDDYETTKAVATDPNFDFSKINNPDYPYSIPALFQEKTYLNTFEALIDLGAKAELFDKNGVSLLSLASRAHKSQLVDKILAKGFSANWQGYNKKGELIPSPLHHVFQGYPSFKNCFGEKLDKKSYLDTLRVLFQYGANPNVQDKLGYTALHYSFGMPNTVWEDTLTLFAQNGFDFHIKDKSGQSLERALMDLTQQYAGFSFTQQFEKLLTSFRALQEKQELQRTLEPHAVTIEQKSQKTLKVKI